MTWALNGVELVDAVKERLRTHNTYRTHTNTDRQRDRETERDRDRETTIDECLKVWLHVCVSITSPIFVLTDLEMPELDGVASARCIREHLEERQRTVEGRTPPVFMSLCTAQSKEVRWPQKERGDGQSLTQSGCCVSVCAECDSESPRSARVV